MDKRDTAPASRTQLLRLKQIAQCNIQTINDIRIEAAKLLRSSDIKMGQAGRIIHDAKAALPIEIYYTKVKGEVYNGKR